MPAIGLLYSIPDDTILMWEITNSEGDYLFKFNVEKTVTQETVNGGTIERENAFLPMAYATKIISKIDPEVHHHTLGAGFAQKDSRGYEREDHNSLILSTGRKCPKMRSN